MKILLASTEVAPFAKAGGLADIASYLPLEWSKFGQSPIVVMPKYGFIDVDKYNFEPTDQVIYVPMSHWIEYARLWYGTLPDSDVPVYLIENQDYFDRKGIYGDPSEYWDNDRRFIFFSRAVFETARAINFEPDIIHAHDFHTAFAMAFLKSQYRTDPMFSRTAGIFTIHNLAYQGWFNAARAMDFSNFGLSEIYPGSWFEKYGSVNAMKTGIMFADKITTVSPTYAHEIRTPEFSEGLQDILNHRGADLVGILNGVYYNEWSPEVDPHLFEKFNIDSLEIKKKNKYRFLHELGFHDDGTFDLPLIGMVTRLAEQKGIDLLMNKLDHWLGNERFRLVMLGSGEAHYEDFFRHIQWKYPELAYIYIGYNNELSHRIIGCSDFLFMPSRFEPCGLTQMYALKYGTVPIVRQTGGLADTVKEYIPASGEGTGFVFWNYNPDDFAYALRRALSVYYMNGHIDFVRRNGMSQDFSSSRSAMEYLKVFKYGLEKVRGKMEDYF
jgi:starch synthase